MNIDFSAEPLAEDALLLRFGERMDAATNARVHKVAARLRAAGLPDITDIAPAYANLLLRFDPQTWIDAHDPNGSPHARLLAAVRHLLRDVDFASEAGMATAHVVEIPVCYGGELGPDLEDVARHAKLDMAQAIARHAAADYNVAMLGFAPGFAYLLGLDPALHAPRRATPRTRVPAGSVAIGGAQTGIYPRELPGGWNLIGRTPFKLFDAQREPPCLLAPGDTVRFRPIAPREFVAMAETVENCGEGTPPFDLQGQGRSQ